MRRTSTGAIAPGKDWPGSYSEKVNPAGKFPTGARASTLRATVHSRERADVPMVVRHARRGQATRPRLHLAAAVGPVLVDMLDRYEVYAGLGDG